MLEDKVLIWWFNHGRPEVLHQIYDKYKADLLTLATALLRDPAVAEDRGSRCVHIVAQDVRQVQAYRQPERLFSDLRRQRCSRHQAARQRHASTDLDQVGPIVTHSDEPDRAAALNEQIGRLNRALAQLPHLQREALVLRVYGQMKFREIARQQGVSTNTAVGRYQYAIKKLRSLLDGEVRL